MPGTEVVRRVMDEWRAGIDSHDAQRVAAAFDEDAIFQGLRSYSVGRRGVADYYDSQPPGMTVTYQVLETRTLTDDLVLGYLSADFAYTDRPTVRLHLGVVVGRRDDDWRILHYQASSVPG
ncbi:SgcJ/EcaC family oxidoreductase [Mycolicibacterium litorale]|uniref:SnoaL-like domain-containing protein n=1 Tax=Mycolicibacterium litorale TaxID=758802 RepID=A0AAD1IRE8_9MYCO|nr:SgcJ/EcaC family oxidoreductase [Mycolicibacterium litorale]MCV7418292.1 SgcJ/EcaC family oxidoreductase [Mycolicibacterium litorale]TDY06314.1 uncharacterized protein (TIGR02246 family) [Mycolicibacterium litorale]BBY19541.1 hypothetical protein MLIT_51330 [Mycolicibacterium litorale]